MKNEIKYIDVNLVLEAEENPRADFNEVFIDGLAQSIARQGLINPITVREANGGCYEVVCGAQRLRAFALAREKYGLKQKEIPAIVVEGKESQLAEIRIVENLQRAQLTPAEEAAGVMALMRSVDLNGMPIYPRKEDVAAALGVSVSWVRDRIKIAEMNEQLEKKIEDLPVAVAREIAKLPADLRERAIEEFTRSTRDTDEARLEDALEEMVETDLVDEGFYFNETFAGKPACEGCAYFYGGRYCFKDRSECAAVKYEAVKKECGARLREATVKELLAKYPKCKPTLDADASMVNITTDITAAAVWHCGMVKREDEPKNKKPPTLADIMPEDYDGPIEMRDWSRPEVYEDDAGVKVVEIADAGEFRGMEMELFIPVARAKKILAESLAAQLWVATPQKNQDDKAAKALEAAKNKVREEMAKDRYKQFRVLRAQDVMVVHGAKGNIRATCALVCFELAQLGGNEPYEVLRELGRFVGVDIEDTVAGDLPDYEQLFRAAHFDNRQTSYLLAVAALPLYWSGLYPHCQDAEALPDEIRPLEDLIEGSEKQYNLELEYRLKQLETDAEQKKSKKGKAKK